jgi:hypothetical protein
VIIELSDSAPPQLRDEERLDRLHATVAGDPARTLFNEFCSPGPDAEHVWVDIANLRAAVLARVDDPGVGDQFDGVIAYATSKGWLDESGTHVRAHIEP